MGIQVSTTEEVFAVRQHWADAGLITRAEMKTDCSYATPDKTWVKEPDGNDWEVFVVLKDNLPEKSVVGQCCAPMKTAEEACCTTTSSEPCCLVK